VDAEAVGDEEGDGDADGDIDADGDLDADGVADRGRVVDAAGDVTVSAAGMKAGLGPGTAEEGAAGCAREITGAGGAAVEVRGTAALGTSCAAEEEGRAFPLRAKLTATDAPSTAAVTPAATSGRHTVRARLADGAGLAG